MHGTNRNPVFDLSIWLVMAGAIVYAATRLPELQRVLEQSARPASVSIAKTSSDADGNGPEPVTTSGDQVELKADQRGHFQSDIEINGRSVPAMVDTGASIVVITYEDAERAGIFLRDRDFTLRTQTANGIGKAAPVTLERVSVGSITVRNVEAAVSEPGALRTNLLGMSFLKRLQRFEVRSGRLVLQE